MKSFKKGILFIHRWLGLITGLIVFIVSVTGCLLAFQPQITNWSRRDLLYTTHQEAKTLPIKELQKKTARALGLNHLPYGLVTYNDPTRNWTVLSYIPQPGSWTYFGMSRDYRTAYINPYTGEVAGIVNEKHDFFQIMKAIHWSLWLATPIGQPIVVWSTLLFAVSLVTGIVLWWPRRWNRSHRKKSFGIKWKAAWRRVNYDLHNVVGFYALILALIIVVTGFYWAFPFAKKSLYFIGTGEFRLPPVQTQGVSSDPGNKGRAQSPMDIAYAKAWNKYPDAFSIAITAPTDSVGTIRARVRGDGLTYYQSSLLKFDQYDGSLLSNDPYSEKNAGEKLLAMNYDIHVGTIGGIFGQILAFLASLICASLPVTGFIIWWDRGKRKKRVLRRKISSSQSAMSRRNQEEIPEVRQHSYF